MNTLFKITLTSLVILATISYSCKKKIADLVNPGTALKTYHVSASTGLDDKFFVLCTPIILHSCIINYKPFLNFCMKTTERFTYLLAKYLNDTISLEERNEFFELISSGDFDAVMDAHFEKAIRETGGDNVEHLPLDSDRLILHNIVNSEKTVPFTLKNKKNE